MCIVKVCIVKVCIVKVCIVKVCIMKTSRVVRNTTHDTARGPKRVRAQLSVEGL